MLVLSRQAGLIFQLNDSTTQLFDDLCNTLHLKGGEDVGFWILPGTNPPAVRRAGTADLRDWGFWIVQ